MKATGIVRRIDELGRVVIPKEIRRTYRIRVGDPLEIFTDRDGHIVFKKYSPIAELSNYASEYALALKESLSCNVFICDKDVVLAAAGDKIKEYVESYISKALIDKIETKDVFVAGKGEAVEVIEREDVSKLMGQIICPICLDGDVIGCVVLSSKDKAFNDADIQVAKTIAMLLEKQMEC